jgi:aryl-alcohol dehydrogenase-like predicted oxidoreductase
MTSTAGSAALRPLSDEGVSALGLGCSRVGSLGNTTPPAEVRRTVLTAFESGVSVFDTANIYGQGDSERLLGQLFAREPKAFIVTKAGYQFSLKARLAARAKPLIKPLMAALRPQRITEMRGGVIGQDFAPAALRASLEGSLRRLRRETVSGFLLHDPPPEAIASPEVWDLLAALKREGKAERVGASIQTLADLETIADNPVCEFIQAPLDVLLGNAGHPAYRRFADRGAAIFVRQVLQPPGGGARSPGTPGERVRMALALPAVACVVVGTSRVDHLRELIASV